MKYEKTLNLPRTNLPLKSDPAETELETLSLWKSLNVYEKRQRLNRGRAKYTVHNPPLPAHGDVRIDDALDMILKDITVKYKLMNGFDVPYHPIWNCYVPAIEREVLQSLENKRSEIRQSELRKQCKNRCLKYINAQREQFQRLGIFAQWNKAVLTSDPAYESRVIETFGHLYEAGYLYKGVKPTFWCIDCQADLNETEIEYRDYSLLSLYVKFPLIQGLEELGEDIYIIVWTNTPWTLLANRSVAVHPDHDYVAVEMENDEVLIMAASAVKDTLSKCNSGKHKVIKKMKGLELGDIVCAHPLVDRDSNVILDKHVSFSRGTGCVHTAPRYSQHQALEKLEQRVPGASAPGEGYPANLQRDPEIISAVDQDGYLTDEAGRFYGHNVFESSNLISMELERRGCLLASEPVEQLYPHCSYCKQPIVVRLSLIHI